MRAIAVGYPLLIVAVTLLTRNHFWLDAVASAAATAVAAGAVVLARGRRVGASSPGMSSGMRPDPYNRHAPP